MKLVVSLLVFNKLVIDFLSKVVNFLVFTVKILLLGSFLLLSINLNLVVQMFNLSLLLILL